ncbi:MAG: hypothetical protein HUU10_04190 [Bacteroidetes bacterium]|nr:hypothetical protein [Bacteroidota bacterium]
MNQSQPNIYEIRLEKLRSSVDYAISRTYVEFSKQTILRTLDQIRRYGQYAEEVAIVGRSYGVMDAEILSRIREENTDVDRLIGMVRRNDPVIGDWTIEKFEGMINGFAESYSRAFAVEANVN